MVDPSLSAFEEISPNYSEFTLNVKVILENGTHLIVIVFYPPPDRKTEAYVRLQEEIRLLNLRYEKYSLIIMADFNSEPQNKDIQLLVNQFGLSI